MNFGHKAIKMNHSNCPNTRIEISATCANIVSIKPIEAGVPLSFDYNTTEWEMSEPFTDWETGQNVQGFRHASAEEQRRLLTGFAAPPETAPRDRARHHPPPAVPAARRADSEPRLGERGDRAGGAQRDDGARQEPHDRHGRTPAHDH